MVSCITGAYLHGWYTGVNTNFFAMTAAPSKCIDQTTVRLQSTLTYKVTTTVTVACIMYVSNYYNSILHLYGSLITTGQCSSFESAW